LAWAWIRPSRTVVAVREVARMTEEYPWVRDWKFMSVALAFGVEGSGR
jgi:hypothetical protein